MASATTAARSARAAKRDLIFTAAPNVCKHDASLTSSRSGVV
jgi:hypothetical protein